MSTYLVYVRQSYHRTADAEMSPEAQQAAAVGLLPAGASHEVIRDVGGHRSGRADRRPGFQRLLQRITDPDVAGVAVYDLSRIGRSGRLVLNLHHELGRRDLELLVANMRHGFRGATGRYMLGQLALAAQLQADLDSERMVTITRTKHEAGGHNGRDPYGYRTARDAEGRVAQPHRLEPVEAEAAVIRDVFDRYGRGAYASRGALAAALNAEGIRRGGRTWTDQSVRDILRRAGSIWARPYTIAAPTFGPARTSRSFLPSRPTPPPVAAGAMPTSASARTLDARTRSNGSSTAPAAYGCAAGPSCARAGASIGITAAPAAAMVAARRRTLGLR